MLATQLDEVEEVKYKLLGSFLEFTRYFYKARTGREFELSDPNGRESHYITIARALTQCHRQEIQNLIINIPPRYAKTEMVIHFIAWCMAHDASCQFIYVSYSHTLATKQTSTIRQILSHPHFKRLFGVELSDDTQAKDNFETTAGGSVYAVGAGGSITGRGAGISKYKKFGGCIVIDDIIKPQDALSDTIRESRNEWFNNTLVSRLNSRETPIIFIGQRVHEEDLAGKLLNGFDGKQWDKVILPALDDKQHALLPTLHTVKDLMLMSNKMPYEFSAQYQQNPQPAGGGIYKRDWFVLLDEFPEMLLTFITVDTAETDKEWNDATVFNFLGLYKIMQSGIDTGLYGLHCIDCKETRVEPKDLQDEFMNFYADCSRFKVRPKQAYIEKKSTGTTLASVLESMQGIAIVKIERTAASGSKVARFMRCQTYVASRQISFLRDAKHTEMCIKHMAAITANNTHAHDDIADTFADAIQIALIDQSLMGFVNAGDDDEDFTTDIY